MVQPGDDEITQKRARAALERLMRQLGYDPADYDDVYYGSVRDGDTIPPRTLVIPLNRLPDGHPLREDILSKMRELVEDAAEQRELGGDPSP